MEGNLQGIIVEVNRRTALVAGDNGLDYSCQYSPEIDLAAFSNFAVGDKVVFTAAGSQQEAMITDVLPRRSKISRPGPSERSSDELVLAANADTLVVVVTPRQPDFNPRLIDRYLALAEHFDLAALICMNKCDLDEALPPELEYLARLGYPVLACSAKTGAGMEALKKTLQGLLVLLSGSSGVGKSSLIRALVPGSDPRIDEVRKGAGKGRHTTTASHLYRTGADIRIIDSPGIRELGFWKVSRKDFSSLWRDFKPLREKCRFRDCNHHGEPGCAVAQAVEAGIIPLFRYQSYLKILDSLPDGSFRPD